MPTYKMKLSDLMDIVHNNMSARRRKALLAKIGISYVEMLRIRSAVLNKRATIKIKGPHEEVILL